jgi:anti-anti-sigma regulatory factor
MALFSKPPVKKPEPTPPEAKPRPAVPGRSPSARDVAQQAATSPGRDAGARQMDPAMGDITVTGTSLMDWSPAHPAIEVAQANPGLCAGLENAALLFASGQAQPARALLEQGVQTDHDTKLSPLAWLALFDLLQRAGDKAAFDQFALQYVVQFERSAPAWEARIKPQIGPRAAPSGGYIALTGVLSVASVAPFEALKRAIEKQVPQVRLDFASVTGFDDAGARLAAEALGEARRRQFPIQLQRAEKLKPKLEAAVAKGREGGEGAWMLSLELLQWAMDRTAFEDRAVEFAVAFELSPPSWEPPKLPEVPKVPDAAAAAAGEGVAGEVPADAEFLVWSGVMAGSLTSQLGKLAEFAQRRSVVPIDMTQVERVDFVCAGALFNAISRIETQHKAIQLVGATPIVRALLLLIGISPRHFVKKAQ